MMCFIGWNMVRISLIFRVLGIVSILTIIYMSGALLKLESPLHDKQPNRRGITTKVKNRINDDIDHFVLSKTTSLRITTAQTTTKTLSLAETTTVRTNKILSVNQEFNTEHTHISSKNESTSLEESRPTETETAGTKLSNKRLQKCSVSKIDHKKAQAKIKLDRNKFLLPILTFGPNNQLLGLRESMLVAIKLNRSLVIPQFYPQFNDPGRHGLQVVSPKNRINVEHLAEFMTTVTLEEFQQECNHTIDAIFQTRPINCNELHKVERDNDIRIFSDQNREEYIKSGSTLQCPPSNIPSYPKNVRSKIVLDIKKLNDIYNSTARCPIFLHPYIALSVDFHEGVISNELFNSSHVDKLLSFGALQTASDDVIFAAIERATTRPQYVANIAKNFVDTSTNNLPFIAIHWRYDEEIIAAMCRLNPKDKICNKVFVPEQVARAIAQVQQKMIPKGNTKLRVPIYIAAPPTLGTFIREVKGNLTELYTHLYSTSNNTKENFVWTLDDLEKFIDERYPAELCPDIRPTPNELISLVEMEVCAMSDAFLWSHFSSWSRVIAHFRPTKIYPHDTCVFDLVAAAAAA